MKQVCKILGVARSNMAIRLARPQNWRDGRKTRTRQDDGLVEEIQRHIGQLPSYGYRRIWALVRRDRMAHDAQPVNAKRIYRVMRDHGLLLERRQHPPMPTRRHEGQIAVLQSNQRWCSDGFEFRCDDGSPLRVTFALDCCDREAMSWAATTAGHSGNVVRDVMLAALEHRFGTADHAPSKIEWLTDNGSAYIAGKTRAFAQQIGLKPVTTPVRSPQSNGMAESFVKTIKRDYITFMPKPDVPTALQNLAIAFEHYNEQHPHSALKYRSPREFRRQQNRSTQG